LTFGLDLAVDLCVDTRAKVKGKVTYSALRGSSSDAERPTRRLRRRFGEEGATDDDPLRTASVAYF
jgi:hypothetical protein